MIVLLNYSLFVTMLFKNFTKLFFCFAFCLLSFVSQAYAQNSVAGIGISPAKFEPDHIVALGEVLTQPIEITNLSGVEQTYYLYLRDITSVKDGGVPVFAQDGHEKTGYELTTWLKLDIEEIRLKPGEHKPVVVTISVPNNATPGSHFGGVFVSMVPPRLRSTGASVGYEVANIISIRVAGDVVENAQIRSFATGNYIYGKAVVDFDARVENKGSILLSPFGPLEIYNMFGKRVAMITINDTKAGIFPHSGRNFNITWTSDNGGFGRYEAVVSMVYGEQGRQSTISSTTSFWILPLNILLPAVGALFFLLITAYISIKLYIRKSLRAASQGTRRIVRSRKQSGVSALLLVMVVMLGVTALFLIILLALFA